jgi:alanine racemase
VTANSSGSALRWAEVDERAMRHNAELIRACLRPETRLMAMVKSNGYGHGFDIAARAAIDGGATWLGVYTPDEALAVRDAGFDVPVLVAGWSPPSTHQELVARDVDITVFDAAGLQSVARAGSLAGRRARVHVKLDTGLSRLGVQSHAIEAMRDALRALRDQVQVAGLLTHFADAESDHEFTREQHRRFLDAVEVLRPSAPDALLHTAGSAAILNFPETHHDMVRLGISLYGYAPHDAAAGVPLRIAMSLFARVVQVKTVAAGDTVGYGRTWRSSHSRRIATVAIGYGQGLPRVLSNRGHLVVDGVLCPIAGIVNMDQVTVDVSDAARVEVGDEAMIFGARDGVRLRADELATLAGTIAHEILCGVAGSVPRVAIGGRDRANDGRPTAVP